MNHDYYGIFLKKKPYNQKIKVEYLICKSLKPVYAIKLNLQNNNFIYVFNYGQIENFLIFIPSYFDELKYGDVTSIR